MKSVLLDATSIPANRGGVGRYLDGIVPELQSSGIRLVVVCQPRDAARFIADGVETIPAPPRIAGTARRFLWEQVSLPRLARKLAVDLIHSPHYTFPLATRRRRVVTVHDLTFFSHPQLHTRLKRTFFKGWIRANAWCGNTIIAPSAATAKEYQRFTRAPDSHVVVARHGIDTVDFHVPTPEEISQFVRDCKPAATGWIAFLGTLEPRKNVVALIRAYARAMAGRAEKDRPSLLLAGGPGWDNGIDPAIDDARAQRLEVHKLGYLPLEQLSAFLGGATIVAYPSLGEGFGLPVLEAMAAGGCVLTTPLLSLPEVGGNAVAYSRPDSESLAQAIETLLDDPHERERLRTAAVARAAEFTWKSCADSHLAAYSLAAA